MPTESFAGTASSLLKELDVRPGALLSWAWWLFVLGIGAIAIAQRQASRRGLIALEADERVTRADAATMSKSLSIRPEARELFDRVAKGELESPRDSLPFPFGSIPRLRRLYAAFADPPTPRPEARALQDARRWLVEIKFQQSFTSSWSGALKLAVGAETSLSRGRSLAQQQLTLPEIVDGFTRFLRQVITDFEYTVIVGIDELDKLESDEKAQRFLNEIKAIFGIEGVYYLISVSENAMSNFERRGLPFRDVFDSSFDDVVAVDYLTFADSRRLLNERIVGMPRQFQALCHCLSGGLARELLRTCRDLVEQAALPGAAHDLHALAGSLLRLDLRAKTRAMAFAAERLDLEPQRSDFLHVLHRLPEAEISRHALHQAHLKLMTAATAGWAVDAEKDSAAARLRDLSLEAGSYLYYLATLAELFTAGLDQAAMEWLGDAGIDNIAHALQALAVSPRVTRSLLDDMRLRGLRRPQGDPGFKPA